MSISSLCSNNSSSSSSPRAELRKAGRYSGSDHAFSQEYANMYSGIKVNQFLISEDFFQESSKGNGWFFCSFCRKDLRFTSRGLYVIKTHVDRPRHLAFVQQVTNSGAIPSSNMICDVCNRRYKDHRSLNTHKRIEHMSVKRVSGDSDGKLSTTRTHHPFQRPFKTNNKLYFEEIVVFEFKFTVFGPKIAVYNPKIIILGIKSLFEPQKFLKIDIKKVDI